MSGRRIGAILGKDLRDALRDGRIVVLLLLPIALAIFYNATESDSEERPESAVVVVDPDRLGVGDALRRAAERSVDLEVRSASDRAAARRVVDADDAALAVITGPAPEGDAPARAELLVPQNATPTTQSIAALVPDALTAAAGRPPAAEVTVERLPISAADREPGEVLGSRTILIVVSVVILLAFVALLMVPIQVAEELHTGTFGALRLAATGPEILTAKALCGLLYGVGGTALTLLVIVEWPADPLRFYGGALGLAVSMVGFGLLLGLLSGNPNQINTYGGFLVLPIIFLATAVLIVDSGAGEVVLNLLPFSQGAKLLFDGISEEAPFGTGIGSWLVLAAWAVVGLAAVWRLSLRREL